MIFGDMDIRLLNDGTFKLDGGAVFGLVPKPLWEKTTPADAANRVPMRCGMLLIKHPSATILIDAGWGAKLSPKLQSIYDRPEHATLVKELKQRLYDLRAQYKDDGTVVETPSGNGNRQNRNG